MAITKRRNVYANRRYWYHVSTTLTKRVEHLKPRGNEKGFNRADHEPDNARICVAPSIEQCITAIPYRLGDSCTIYRTQERVRASKPKKVFDINITEEGWLQVPTTFVRLGTLEFEDVERGLSVEHVVEEAASSGYPPASGRVLKWWKKARIKRFIKSS